MMLNGKQMAEAGCPHPCSARAHIAILPDEMMAIEELHMTWRAVYMLTV